MQVEVLQCMRQYRWLVDQILSVIHATTCKAIDIARVEVL
jgi:hypothetical protein